MMEYCESCCCYHEHMCAYQWMIILEADNKLLEQGKPKEEEYPIPNHSE